jgi:hypothetical protein
MEIVKYLTELEWVPLLKVVRKSQRFIFRPSKQELFILRKPVLEYNILFDLGLAIESLDIIGESDKLLSEHIV